ncbi:MAG: hypothetical protein MAG794_01773 [Gammaproteobacteria bacterium]|nr:hypothetical protein [Gammaproteobacteria bacterium]
MSKATWGVIVAVLAAVVIAVLAASQGFLTGGKSTEQAGTADTSAETGETEIGTEGGTGAAGVRSSESGEPSGTQESEDSLFGDDETDTAQTGTADTSAETGETETGSEGDTGVAGVRSSESGEPSGTQESEDSLFGDDETDTALQGEAESYVEQLAEPSDKPLRLDRAEAFVSPDRPMSKESEETGAAGTPRREAPEVAVDSTPQPEAPEVATKESAPEAETVETRAGESTSGQQDSDAGMESSAEPRVDLPLNEEAPVTIADLIGPEEVIPSDAVFYVHTVQPEDDQGIWGVVHHGIVENFARGVAVHRGESSETYRVDIPRHADERRPDTSSSFLGRLIHEKTRQSYVYNYQTERLGRNPDLIIPGQEIVIVRFAPDELISIYKYFTP